MTVGELVYQKAIEAGYDPHLATGLAPSLEKALASYKKIFEDLREPMKTVSSAVESLRPQLDAVKRISFPTIPALPAITEYTEDDSYFPSLIQPVQDVRITNLEEILGATQKQESVVSVASYHLPHNATWESLDIQFIDGHFVKVSYPNMKSQKFNYKDMGFANMKTTNPDLKWELLRTIADNNGALTKSKWNKKFGRNVKYELNQGLKKFFNMDTAPIPHYTRKNGYCPLFSLRKEK